MQLEFTQLTISPGSQLLLNQIDWLQFEEILTELKETRAARLSYSNGFLEIMVPLLEHEDDKNIIGDLVKTILEELNLEFRAVGSTTFKNEKMLQAVEPDECFYIQHEATIRGKIRVDLTQDPPPDLALEIDITSRTRLGNYEALGVPELWRYDGTQLQINLLKSGQYIESTVSHQFPQFPVKEAIPRYVEQSKRAGRNATMKAFRAWIKDLVKPIWI